MTHKRLAESTRMSRRARVAITALTVILLTIPQAGFAQSESMSFFLTSVGPGNGADLGGLEGADAYCEVLAETAGAGDLIWHAYLSLPASDGEPADNARDRIGEGPWYNHDGVMIAASVADLHGDEANLTKESILTETGEMVNGRGDTPNRHDILTGSQLDGTAFSGEEDTTCRNWTSNSEGSARVGHHDRQGGGEHPESWNSAHGSRGCSQENLRGSGGDGLFYCFATDASGERGSTDPAERPAKRN